MVPDKTLNKKMNFANFNVTYGEEELPMLTYFSDIIFPAFCSKLHREVNNSYYYFDYVEVKEINSEYVMVGNLIKVTSYNIRTTIQEQELTSTPISVPTAPYSRFIIFLRNHRMVLVKNESNSPSLNSFQAQARKVVYSYISKTNKEEKKYPEAFIHITNMPLKDDISDVIHSLYKINSVTFRFFPLNNDIAPAELFQAILTQKDSLDSKTGNLVFNSPKNKEGTTNLINDSLPYSKVKVIGEDYNRRKRRIKEDNFSNDREIFIPGDVSSLDDEKIASIAKEEDSMNVVSEANNDCYNSFMKKIKNLVKQLL